MRHATLACSAFIPLVNKRMNSYMTHNAFKSIERLTAKDFIFSLKVIPQYCTAHHVLCIKITLLGE